LLPYGARRFRHVLFGVRVDIVLVGLHDQVLLPDDCCRVRPASVRIPLRAIKTDLERAHSTPLSILLQIYPVLKDALDDAERFIGPRPTCLWILNHAHARTGLKLRAIDRSSCLMNH
jgi:hypothetical protein